MSEDGMSEIALGIVLSVIGLGSIFLPGSPVYCCGFAIIGPILFIIGLAKAVRRPSRAAYRPGFAYPPPYYPQPYAGGPPPPSPPGGPPPAPGAATKACPACGRAVPGNARFCPGCGTPFG
ncbi:MAG TPA: zinc ribbon domain-containing protein [Thermoplasmata archaeon]